MCMTISQFCRTRLPPYTLYEGWIWPVDLGMGSGLRMQHPSEPKQ
jgi:hypothetical protein